MSYYDFKSIYVFMLAIVCGVIFLAIMAFWPLVGLSAVAAFFVLGGAYIVHREGWLDRQICIVLHGPNHKSRESGK